MDARESLVEAINDFEGAVVLVSHDTHLVKMVADQLWLVAGGAVTPFDGDIDEYQAKLLRERNGRPAKEEKEAKPKKEKAAPAPASVSNGEAQARPSQAQRSRRPRRHGRTQQAPRRDRGQAGRSRHLVGPPDVAAELQKEKLRLERELAHAEHDWLVAQEAFEAA
jgi:ATP-binding cassette subfamily F protein 3